MATVTRTVLALLLFATAAVVDAQPGATLTDAPAPQPPRCNNTEALFGAGMNMKSGVQDLRNILTVDLDQDGDLDVLGCSRETGDLFWLSNEGGSPPVFTEVIVDDPLPSGCDVAVGDMNNDGVIDVVATSYNPLGTLTASGTIEVYLFNGNFPYVFTKHTVASGVPGAFRVAVGDLDGEFSRVLVTHVALGDEDFDIVYAAFDSSTLVYLENSGSLGNYTFADHVLSASVLGPNDIQILDMDTDGDNDVLVVSRDDDVMAWWENLGGVPVLFRERRIDTAFDFPTAIEGVDFDFDGDMDVLAVGGGDLVLWYESSGLVPPTFTKHALTTGGGTHTSLDADVADVDNDGDYDIISTDTFGSNDVEVIWLENDGTNLAFMRHAIGEQFFASGSGTARPFVASGDLNGDSYIDIIFASSVTDVVRWYPNVCVPVIEPTTVPTAIPTIQAAALPSPAPTSPEPTATPSTTKAPSTATSPPSILPTPAPSPLSNCQNEAVDATLMFCAKLSSTIEQTALVLSEASRDFDEFCGDFERDFAV